MKTTKNLLTIGTLFLLPLFGQSTFAQTTSTATYTNRQGDQVTRSTSSTAPGDRTVDRTFTTPNGQTSSRDTTVNRSPGQYSRDTTTTGPNGKTTNYQNNATWGNGTYNDTKSFTGTQGKTQTQQTTRTAGQVTRTYTGRNGHSRTYSHPVRHR